MKFNTSFEQHNYEMGLDFVFSADRIFNFEICFIQNYGSARNAAVCFHFWCAEMTSLRTSPLLPFLALQFKRHEMTFPKASN